MAYQYRRANTADERNAREEINRRTGAVHLAEHFLHNHLKYGGIQGNVQFLSDEVIRLGLAKEETTTERLNELLGNVEHHMAVSPHYTAAWAAFRLAWPQLLINESVERGFTKLYRGEYPYDSAMEPARLIGLVKNPWANSRGLIQSNGTWEAGQKQLVDMQKSAADSGRKIAAMLRRFYDAQGEIYGSDKYIRAQNEKLANAEQARLTALSTTDLDAEFARLTENNRVSGLTREQARAEVRLSESKRLATYSRYEQLPSQYTPIGKTEGVEWTERLLKSLPSSELSRLLKIFGDQQLSAAIQSNAVSGRQ